MGANGKSKYKKVQTKKGFHPATILAKCHLRKLRLDAGLAMTEGAAKLNMTRKVLEDTETHRPYGRYLDWTLIILACEVYSVSPDLFVEPLPDEYMQSLIPSVAGKVHGGTAKPRPRKREEFKEFRKYS